MSRSKSGGEARDSRQRFRHRYKILYVILVYDVGQARVGKVCKTLRRSLTWVQNSVFEGEVSEAGFKQIQADLSKILDGHSDSVLFYCIQNPKGWEKRVMGQERGTTGTFL